MKGGPWGHRRLTVVMDEVQIYTEYINRHAGYVSVVLVFWGCVTGKPISEKVP